MAHKACHSYSFNASLFFADNKTSQLIIDWRVLMNSQVIEETKVVLENRVAADRESDCR